MPDQNDSCASVPENSGVSRDRRGFLKGAGLAGMAGAFAGAAGVDKLRIVQAGVAAKHLPSCR